MNAVLKRIFTRRATNAETHKLYFQRKTSRYAQKGSISSNQGYLKVSRDEATGRFVSATK